MRQMAVMRPKLTQHRSNDVPVGSWMKPQPSMIKILTKQLREEWCPEQISGLISPFVGIGSYQWTYSLIWNNKAC